MFTLACSAEIIARVVPVPQANAKDMAALALHSPARPEPPATTSDDVIRMSQDVTTLAEQMKAQRKALNGKIAALEAAHVRTAVGPKIFTHTHTPLPLPASIEQTLIIGVFVRPFALYSPSLLTFPRAVTGFGFSPKAASERKLRESSDQFAEEKAAMEAHASSLRHQIDAMAREITTLSAGAPTASVGHAVGSPRRAKGAVADEEYIAMSQQLVKLAEDARSQKQALLAQVSNLEDQQV